MSLTGEIKDYALDLGYQAVGVATAEPFPAYADALAERSDDYNWCLDHGLRLRRSIDPRDRLPGAKSIIVAIYDYFRESFPPQLVGRIGRLYQARCYLAPPHRLGGARIQLMRQLLEQKGMQVARWFGPSSGVPDRWAAVRAGVGQFGRNTFVAAPGIGTFINIHTFLVDAELEYDEPTPEMHCPPRCRLCLDACPTGAIVADFRVNPRRCIPFNHFATIEGLQNSSSYIEPAVRAKMGGWFYGCDVCQEVCPRNHGKLEANLPNNTFLVETARHFSLPALLESNDECYARIVTPLMYQYLGERKYFQRNAAVALGNSGDRDAVRYLARALEDREELVRAHAAWALGQIGGGEARAALEAALGRESGERARAEIAAALEAA